MKPEISEPLARGAVAAVQVPGKPDSAGTQFFICVNAQPSLDGKYTVFARVVRGLDVVQAIASVPVDGETPKEKIAIVKIRVTK